jgi:hypothetical protein
LEGNKWIAFVDTEALSLKANAGFNCRNFKGTRCGKYSYCNCLKYIEKG